MFFNFSTVSSSSISRPCPFVHDQKAKYDEHCDLVSRDTHARILIIPMYVYTEHVREKSQSLSASFLVPFIPLTFFLTSL